MSAYGQKVFFVVVRSGGVAAAKRQFGSPALSPQVQPSTSIPPMSDAPSDIERSTARRKAALILDIIQRSTHLSLVTVAAVLWFAGLVFAIVKPVRGLHDRLTGC